MAALKNQRIISGEGSAGAINAELPFEKPALTGTLQILSMLNSMIISGSKADEIITLILKLFTSECPERHLYFLLLENTGNWNIISPQKTETRLKDNKLNGFALSDLLTGMVKENNRTIHLSQHHHQQLKHLSAFLGVKITSLLIRAIGTNLAVKGYILFASEDKDDWTDNDFGHLETAAGITGHILRLNYIEQLEEDIKNIENQYKTLYHSMKRGVVFQDSEGKIFDANPAAEKILGLPSNELIGMTLTDPLWNNRNFNGEKLHNKDHPCMQAISEGKEVKDVMVGIKNTATSKNKLLLVSTYPQFDVESNRISRLFTVLDDITQQHQLIQELQVSEENYRNLVDNALVGVYQTSLDGDILYVNQAAARMFEYGTQLNLSNANILFRYAHPSDRERLLKELKINKGKIENFEVRLLTKNERIVHVIVNGILKDNVISGMLIDITDMKQAAAELRLNEERLESLLRLYEFKGNTDEEISGFALDEAVKITSSKVGYLHFINEDQKTIKLNTWSTETLKTCDAAKDSHYPIEKAGIWVESFHKRRPVIHNDYPNIPDRKGYPEGHIHLERHMSVPVFDGKKIVAIAGVGNKQEPYNEGDVRQFSLFMNSMWGILKKNRAEKALKESEELYRSFVQNFQGIAFRLKPDWSPVFFHGSVENLTGYTEQDFLAQNPDWFDIVHPQDLKSIINKYPSEVFLTPGYTAERKYRIIRKNGEVRWVHDVVHTQFDENNLPEFINGVVLDITASKQTEEEFETLFNLSSDLICIASLEGYFLKMNPAFNELLGYSDKELKSRPYIDFIIEEDKQKTLDVITEELRKGKTVINFQNRYRCKDGHIIWLDWNSKPIPELDMTFAVARDITSQKQSEDDLNRMMQELERSNRDLEEFAYVASHDLQEPLRNIKSFTELFANRFKSQIDETADKYINYIIDGTARMQKLISDLLSLSRITTKGKAFEMTDIGECIRKALENIDLQIKENNATIEYGEMPTMLVDSSQIVQLFQNLLSNAIKFRKKESDPVISIEVKEKPRFWQFKVRDNGIGMEMKYADRIFVIFQRLHTRTEYPGTGIGLAICKKIVERHGGQIKVKSAPGKGSAFKFTLRIK
ncbi:MAG: PAS domain S-box protein [Bacteroidales bacterium]|nr:PAS domain S-box protein [Bacteroidales bacterium]